MPFITEISVPHNFDFDSPSIKATVAKFLDISIAEIAHIELLRKSLDARKRPIVFLLKVAVYKVGEKIEYKEKPSFQTVQKNAKTCHIIGLGPAGIFAALECIALGIKPIVLERGKNVNERLHDIASIHKTLVIDSESNYCFGEGGAGTYSDGKLYTRSSKRGDIKKVLQLFIAHGADPKIDYEAHPHIGTNKLPRIIAQMRQTIIAHGGEIHFQKKITDFIVVDNKITKIKCSDSDELACEQVILATGHSARDIFELLHRNNILIEAKPFAVGVRIEHRQELIDQIQYKLPERAKTLPPATYSLVTQACGRGIFSFCMCPGGVIAPAGTAPGETVVNGWSASARNGPYSNSGLVVEVKPENWQKYRHLGPLAALAFQQEIEKTAYNTTGSIKAPAQRIEDFIQMKASSTLPRSSYQPGLMSTPLLEILPSFIVETLREGLTIFGNKMKGYRTNEGILVGVESRTSSPVRIPRDKESLRHPQITNLYPCGEGAGYAGGIVSAAMDGIACATKLEKN
jgi:uncharacterized FAD-dependent dehydrogenase